MHHPAPLHHVELQGQVLDRLDLQNPLQEEPERARGVSLQFGGGERCVAGGTVSAKSGLRLPRSATCPRPGRTDRGLGAGRSVPGRRRERGEGRGERERRRARAEGGERTRDFRFPADCRLPTADCSTPLPSPPLPCISPASSATFPSSAVATAFTRKSDSQNSSFSSGGIGLRSVCSIVRDSVLAERLLDFAQERAGQQRLRRLVQRRDS